jgi:tyrosyl-tRNA synthetase
MIKQGAARIDGARIEDASLRLSVGASCICQVGKRRFARVILDN